MKKSNFKLYFSASIIILIVFMSIFAPFIAPQDPTEIDMSATLVSPSADYPLGTDALGRDMLSRVIYGGRASLVIALAATTLSMFFGLILGMVSGYFGGILDASITGIANIFQGIPGTCFMVAIAGVLGPGNMNLIFALFISSWAGFSRIVRTETLLAKQQPYIEGLRSLGIGHLRILWKHIFVNMSSNIIVLFTARVGRAVLAVAALSYLGLGVAPPMPDWSVMINDARMHYRSAPHLIIVPGLCIFILLFAINMLGDALRDKFDVKSRELYNV